MDHLGCLNFNKFIHMDLEDSQISLAKSILTTIKKIKKYRKGVSLLQEPGPFSFLNFPFEFVLEAESEAQLNRSKSAHRSDDSIVTLQN